MIASRAEGAARLLYEAFEKRRQIEALPSSLRPRSQVEAYAVQASLENLLGPVIGWKLAATSAPAREEMGLVEPVIGRIFECLQRTTDDPVALEGLELGVAEAEFAFVLDQDLPYLDGGYEPSQIADAIATAHPAIEVPASRLRDPRSAGAGGMAADSAFAGPFILGPGHRGWRDLDIDSAPVRIEKAGSEVARGSGAAVLGGPLHALAWLAGRPEHGGLRRGQVILTGSTTPPVPIAPGDHIRADFGALGWVSAYFCSRQRLPEGSAL